MNNVVKLHAISSVDDKEMANGMRNTSGTPLSEDEIEYVKKEIERIKADESVFIFNNEEHLKNSTCYNFETDKIYVTRNVFPDEKYASAHPRDTMSVRAVLAHEYYGQRQYRNEYLADWEKGMDYHTTPIWKDECRASLTVAHDSPGLTEIDKRDLVLDAVFRAKEFGQLIEMNDFMKEAVYGYSSNERTITSSFEQPKYVSEESQEGNFTNGIYDSGLSEMQRITSNNNDSVKRTNHRIL